MDVAFTIPAGLIAIFKIIAVFAYAAFNFVVYILCVACHVFSAKGKHYIFYIFLLLFLVSSYILYKFMLI